MEKKQNLISLDEAIALAGKVTEWKVNGYKEATGLAGDGFEVCLWGKEPGLIVKGCHTIEIIAYEGVTMYKKISLCKYSESKRKDDVVTGRIEEEYGRALAVDEAHAFAKQKAEEDKLNSFVENARKLASS